MRSDPTRRYEFFDLDTWNQSDLGLETFRLIDPNDESKGFKARSFSGHERNRLFLQTDDNFDDVSLVSGADFNGDCRSFAMLDYDRDGWMDMVIASPLAPRFQIFRNQMSAKNPKSKSVFVSLEGGNTTTKQTLEWSNRDGIGAQLTVNIGDSKRAFQRACGEGLASQNSKWIHIGMGEAPKIDSIDVRWPSGKKTVHKNIEAGKRVTLSEKGDTTFEK